IGRGGRRAGRVRRSKPLLLSPGHWRAMIGVLRVVIVPALNATEEIDALLMIVNAGVRVERIVEIPLATIERNVDPGDEAEPPVLRAKIVAEVIAAKSRAKPEINKEVVRRYDDLWLIEPARLRLEGVR